MTNTVTGRMGAPVSGGSSMALNCYPRAKKEEDRSRTIHQMAGVQHFSGAVAYLLQSSVCGYLRSGSDARVPAGPWRIAAAGGGFVGRNTRGHSVYGSSSECLPRHRRGGLRDYRSLRLLLLRVGVRTVRECRAAKRGRRILDVGWVLPAGHDQQWQHPVHIGTGARS